MHPHYRSAIDPGPHVVVAHRALRGQASPRRHADRVAGEAGDHEEHAQHHRHRQHAEKLAVGIQVRHEAGQAELPVRMQVDAASANVLRKPFSKDELIARLAPMIDALRDSRAPAVGLEDG
jgi:hypothetical protein